MAPRPPDLERSSKLNFSATGERDKHRAVPYACGVFSKATISAVCVRPVGKIIPVPGGVLYHHPGDNPRLNLVLMRTGFECLSGAKVCGRAGVTVRFSASPIARTCITATLCRGERVLPSVCDMCMRYPWSDCMWDAPETADFAAVGAFALSQHHCSCRRCSACRIIHVSRCSRRLRQASFEGSRAISVQQQEQLQCHSAGSSGRKMSASRKNDTKMRAPAKKTPPVASITQPTFASPLLTPR